MSHREPPGGMAKRTGTPAGELREAARLMQERVQAATEGPWRHMCLGSEGCLVLRATGTVQERGRGRVARFGQKEWKADHADAEYVAGMHPKAGKALGRLLDEKADEYETYDAETQAFLAGDRGGDTDPAVEIARIYLGRTP